jgi:5-methylcytosine-specific restriction endonuclease McrA
MSCPNCQTVNPEGACDAMDELHFDHDLPYSKGGVSITEENVQLLCSRHNLEKGAKII